MKTNLDIDLKKLPILLKKVFFKVQRYSVITFIVILVGCYGYLIVQISRSATAEPSQDQITTELGTVKRLRIDQVSIDKIQRLKDQNVTVKALFEDARNNPFSE